MFCQLSASAGQRPAQREIATRAAGFTLLELLVVLLIIGLLVSLASLSIKQNSSRAVADEANRLYGLLRLAGEQAVFQGQELALQFNGQGYVFMQLDGEAWQPIVDDQLLRERQLPQDIQLDLSLEGARVGQINEQSPARIFLLSSGELTPFELSLRNAEGDEFILRGGIDGVLELGQTPHES